MYLTVRWDQRVHTFNVNYMPNITLYTTKYTRMLRVIIEKIVFLDTLHLIAIEIQRMYVYFNFF